MINCIIHLFIIALSSTFNMAKEQNDMFNAASIKEGKKISIGCTACHSLEKHGPNKIGPNLYGIIGRKIASKNNFVYSPALKKFKSKTWNVDLLFEWIRDPSEFAPGTKMDFTGLPDPQDRMDLIAYLATLK